MKPQRIRYDFHTIENRALMETSGLFYAWSKAMPRANEKEFLAEVLLGHAPAIEFCQTLFKISQTLDDLVDKDRPLTDKEIIESYWMALIELPGNSFYRQHEPCLRPLMAAALQDWRDSSILELEDSDHSRNIAFVLRDQLGAIVTHCAYLLGGREHMNKVSVEVRKHTHEDSLDQYKHELKKGIV